MSKVSCGLLEKYAGTSAREIFSGTYFTDNGYRKFVDDILVREFGKTLDRLWACFPEQGAGLSSEKRIKILEDLEGHIRQYWRKGASKRPILRIHRDLNTLVAAYASSTYLDTTEALQDKRLSRLSRYCSNPSNLALNQSNIRGPFDDLPDPDSKISSERGPFPDMPDTSE